MEEVSSFDLANSTELATQNTSKSLQDAPFFSIEKVQS
jgi:hypothetical protein